MKEGAEREKLLVGGQRIDVDTYGRLRSDPSPSFDPIPLIDGTKRVGTPAQHPLDSVDHGVGDVLARPIPA